MRVRRILVPTDFSPASDAALAQARELASALGASLRLVHVFDDPFAGGDETQMQDRLAATVNAGLGHDTALLTGPVAHTIVDYAGSHAVDLIVMGTHGRSGVAHLLLGSVAERVVRTAPCPVLTVRQQPLPAPVAEIAAALEPAQA